MTSNVLTALKGETEPLVFIKDAPTASTPSLTGSSFMSQAKSTFSRAASSAGSSVGLLIAGAVALAGLVWYVVKGKKKTRRRRR